MSTATILAPASITAMSTTTTHVTGVKARTPLARLSLQQRRRRLAPTHSHTLPLTAAERLDQQHAPRRWERIALWLLLAPTHGLWGYGGAYWDTWAIEFARRRQRPALRRHAARERAQVRRTLQRITRQTQRACGQACDGAALWDLQMAVLLDTYLATHGKRLMRTVDYYGALCYSLEAIADISADIEKETNTPC